MFSRRVVPHALDDFGESVFAQMIDELRSSPNAGDRCVAHNMALNVDVRAYHAYSFETVAESNSGRLLDEFLAMTVAPLVPLRRVQPAPVLPSPSACGRRECD